MMSMPAFSMSRMAVLAASSNISSMSPGPNSPCSNALTEANHQLGFPWEPTTAVGIRGRLIVTILHSWGQSQPLAREPRARDEALELLERDPAGDRKEAAVGDRREALDRNGVRAELEP